MVAPLAVSVVEDPLQIGFVPDVAVTVGEGLTVTVSCEVFVQPFAAVPVTVYVVVPPGETVTGLPGIEPGFQTYVEAPLPVRFVLPPTQIGLVLAEEVTVGFVLTVIATWAVLEQPEVVPVTV